MYQGLESPLFLFPPLTLNRNQKIRKQILFQHTYTVPCLEHKPKTNYVAGGTKQPAVSSGIQALNQRRTFVHI